MSHLATNTLNIIVAGIFVSAVIVPSANANDTNTNGGAGPALSYATYLGGNDDDIAVDIAVDSAGNRVLCGETSSLALASAGAAQTAFGGGGEDVFVSKISADGATLLFTTYLGGSNDEECNQIAVDGDDNIVIVGATQSPDFPTPGGFDTTHAPGGFNTDAFVTKLSPDGSSIIFSTYLGGQDLSGEEDEGFLFGRETAQGLTLDDEGAIYVVGETSAADFPSTHLMMGRACGTDEMPTGGNRVGDQYVAKLSPVGDLVFSTCFGGGERDSSRAVEFSANGQIVIASYTRSPDYPVTVGAFDSGFGEAGRYDTAVTVLNSDATAILSAARIGGALDDLPIDLKLDSLGRPIVMGATASTDFPVTANAFQPAYGGPSSANFSGGFPEGMLMRFSASLDELEFATYFGGSANDSLQAMALDPQDRIVFLAQTTSADLRLAQPLQADKGHDIGVPRELPTAGAGSIASGQLSNGTSQYFLVFARNGLNDLYFTSARNAPTYVGPLGNEQYDSRSVVAFDVNDDFRSDIVVANFEGPNHIYLNDGNGGFLPAIEFGDPASASVGIAVNNAFGAVTSIIEVNADQQNVVYQYQSGVLGPAVPLGPADSASIGIAPTQERSSIDQTFVEARAPNQVVIHQFEDGIINSTIRTFPGVDIAAVEFGSVDQGVGRDLLIADRNGGVLAVFDDPVNGPVTNFSTDGMPTHSVGYVQDFSPDSRPSGIVSAHDDGLRYFKYNPNGGFFDAQRRPSAAPLTDIHYEFRTGQLFAGGVAATDRYAFIGDRDLYVGVMAADGSALEFGTYLGGSDDDNGGFGLAIDEPGQVVVTGSSHALDFPTVAPMQSSNAGGADAVVASIAYDLPDQDEDGIADSMDNCRTVGNPSQQDSNGDGYGNACDADYNNDCVVNATDLGLLRLGFFGSDPDIDLTGDGVVNAVDLGLFRTLFFAPPGPSGITQLCDD